MASSSSHATPADEHAALDAILQSAIAKFNRGDLPGARADCERALSRNNSYPPALHALGWILSNSGQREQAVTYFKQATIAAPADARFHAEHGRVLISLGRNQEAIESLRTAAGLEASVANLNDLGYALHAAGNLDEATTVLQRALALDQTFVPAHCNLGAVFRAQKRPSRAADCYAMAARLQPNLLEAHLFEGLSHAESGDVTRAESCWRRALALRSDAPMLHDIGKMLLNVKQPAQAVGYFRRAVQAAPNDASQLNALASALIETKAFAEAEMLARRVLEADQSNAAAHVNLAAALHHQRRPEEAVKEYEEALRIDPSMTRARANMADALEQLRRDDEAAANAHDAAIAAPHDEIVLGLRVGVLIRAQRPLDALAAAREAVERVPDSANLHFNLAVALNESNQPEAAIDAFRKALSLDPQHDEARAGLGMALLRLGQLREGWRDYDSRVKPASPPGLRRWDGGDLAGQPILLQVEQGFGDTIQFIRYAPLVAKLRHGRVSVLCSPQLQPLVQTVPNVEHVVTRSDDPRIAKVKLTSLMLDLPRLFDTTVESVPANVPYVSVPDPVDAIRRKSLMHTIDAAPKTPKRAGLVWGGSATYGQNRKRSVPFELFRPALQSATDFTFFSLVVNPSSGERSGMRDLGVVDLSDHLCDFGETAAAISRLDLVISVDTAVAHLAGALAKPVWILLPLVCDWRWLRADDRSPWYPTARLFRQSQLGDWASVINAVGRELKNLL